MLHLFLKLFISILYCSGLWVKTACFPLKLISYMSICWYLHLIVCYVSVHKSYRCFVCYCLICWCLLLILRSIITDITVLYRSGVLCFQWVIPEMVGQCLSTMLMLISMHWFIFLLNLPVAVWNIYRYPLTVRASLHLSRIGIRLYLSWTSTVSYITN